MEKENENISQLVDIRNVKIDRSLPSEERIKSFIEQIKNPYQFKVGDTVVKVSFANTQNTITDNFINMIATMFWFMCIRRSDNRKIVFYSDFHKIRIW